jgi:hypothetical protein
VRLLQAGAEKFSTASSLGTIFWRPVDLPQCLNLNGICYDTVIATSSAHWQLEENAPTDGIATLFKFVLNPQPVTSTTREELHTILRKTLIGDGFFGHVDPQHDLEADFDRCLFRQTCVAIAGCAIQLMKSFFWNVEDNLAKVMETLNVPGSIELFKGSLLRGRSQCDSWEKVVMGTKDLIPNLTLAHYRDTKRDEFTTKWKFSTENRCIFRTERGFLGLGLKTIRAGDRIYILQGAPVPYIFRHRDTDPENVLDLERETYVHGIMYGEALETGNLNFHEICVY